MRTYAITIGVDSKAIQSGWSITENTNGRNRMDCAVLSMDGSDRPAVDSELIFTEDGLRIFGGLIDRPVETNAPHGNGSPALIMRVSAVDFNAYASRIRLTGDRTIESFGARMAWIATQLAAQGVMIAGGQAAGPLSLPAVSYDDRPAIDVLNETCTLASGAGATSYLWEIDYDKVLEGWEAGTREAPFDLADGDGQALGDITVEQPRGSEYANYIRVLGGTGTHDASDAFTGDGVTSSFPLTYTLASSYGYVTVAGVFETLAVQGIGFDDAATWLYYSSDNTIRRVPGAGPPANLAAISFTYVAQFPIAVTADGGVAAANRVMRTYTEKDVFDVVVLQALADSYVARDMSSPKTVDYGAAYAKVGLHPGQVQTIASTKRNLSGSHLLTNVRIQHVGGQLVQRQVTAVTTTRLPSTLREKFQQTFGGSGGSAGSAGSVTVVTGGTYLSSPASLGGSDTQWIACDTPARVRNPQPYDAPATLAVTVQGLVAARSAVDVTAILWDETDGAAEFSDSPVAASATPAPFSISGTVAGGHRYWLYVQSGTAGVTATAVGQVVGA